MSAMPAPTAERSAPARPPRAWWLVPIAVAYLYVVPYYPGIQSANELPRAYLVKAIVDHGTFAIDDGVRRWGQTADVSPSGGRWYSNKAPGTSLVTAPIYGTVKLLGGGEPSLGVTIWLGRLVTGIAPTLLLLWLLPGWLARFTASAEAARLATVVYALGSMAMPYSLLFISHQASAVAAALAYLAVQPVLDGQGGARRMGGAGFAAGMAPLLDYQAALALVPLACLVTYRLWRSGRLRLLAAAALGAALPIAALLAYHQAAFGSPWRTGYDASETFAVLHQQGFLGLSGLRWSALVGSLVTPDNGLLVFSPFWLLAAPGLVRLWRRGHRGEALMMGATAVGMVLFLGSLSFWRGGWQLGPRYITVMLPFLLPALAVALEGWLPHRARGALAVAACVVGVAAYAGSCAQFPHFPERFPNPLVELTWRLWREGYAAPNPLGLLGVPGPWSLAPYVVAVVVAVGGALRRAAGRTVLVGGLTMATAALWALAWLPHGHPDLEARYRWICDVMTRPW